MNKSMTADVIIVGTGVGGLFCALNLPADKKIVMITKSDAESSDSFLAQGGICVLKDENDYESYYEDTMRAGHYENNPEAVEIMIKSSQETIAQLEKFGVEFEKEEGNYQFTREGAHSTPRILFHQDITGKEITSKLLEQVRKCKNVEILENITMVDILVENGKCKGVIVRDNLTEVPFYIVADDTVWASGGVGGLFRHSTNFSHLTGDALAIAMKHGIELRDIDYIQIHPTTLYTQKKGRKFLISESVRGEGAILYDKNHERFVEELLPRDELTKRIKEQMEKDQTPYVLLSMENIPENIIKSHFPNIYQYCLEEGYDVTKECIPVVPAQHYFMGGVKVKMNSMTSMKNLYAVGETSCNGVHGANRLASNSLLESLVFAKRAADSIAEAEKTELDNKELDSKELDNTELEQFLANLQNNESRQNELSEYAGSKYETLTEDNRKEILDEIERRKKERE